MKTDFEFHQVSLRWQMASCRAMWFPEVQGLLGEFRLHSFEDLFLLKPTRSMTALCPNPCAKPVLKTKQSQNAKTNASCILPAGDSTFDSHLAHDRCIVSLCSLGYYRWDPGKVRRARTRLSLCTWKTERKERTKKLKFMTTISVLKVTISRSNKNMRAISDNYAESHIQTPNCISLSVDKTSKRKAEQCRVPSRKLSWNITQTFGLSFRWRIVFFWKHINVFYYNII